MCRWLAYSGRALPLEELIFKPKHSLIDQSLAALTSDTTTNGDGFGVGWYGSREVPGVYRSVRPAWNDTNLRELASQIDSSMFLAHVRATTGAAIQQSNCHPFRYGRWLFMHNGHIAEYGRLRRDLMLAVDPELFPLIVGTTDSELMFYLALTFGLEREPVRALERMAGFVEGLARSRGVPDPLQMTLGVSDGRRLLGVRYSSGHDSRTLYYSVSADALRAIHPGSEYFDNDAMAIVSEPLTEMSDCWREVPESSVVKVEERRVETVAFEPRDPDR